MGNKYGMNFSVDGTAHSLKRGRAIPLGLREQPSPYVLTDEEPQRQTGILPWITLQFNSSWHQKKLDANSSKFIQEEKRRSAQS